MSVACSPRKPMPKTVYAAFDNHKNADFAPYLLKEHRRRQNLEIDRGDLPAQRSGAGDRRGRRRSQICCLSAPSSASFSPPDGGRKWIRIKSGLPTIAVRDLAIQKQMNDLVIGTFGRGIYVLDDYSALRQLGKEKLAEKAQCCSQRARPALHSGPSARGQRQSVSGQRLSTWPTTRRLGQPLRIT